MTLRKVPSDPELFDVGLDHYFGVLDSECGLRGAQRTGDDAPSGNAGAIATQKMRTTKPGAETVRWSHNSRAPLSSAEADSTSDRQLAAVAYGRKVWLALTRVPWGAQELLRRYYSSARALAAMAGAKSESVDHGPAWVEADIRAAHRAYLMEVEGTAEAPVTIDREVGGSTDRAKYRERGAEPRSAAERKAAERARAEAEHGSGSRRAERYEREDSAERTAQEGAEPLLCGLKPGRNEYPAAQFEALAKYFVDEHQERRRAIKLGRFVTVGGRIEVVSVAGEIVSLREYARRTGVSRTTLQRRVGHFDLQSKKVGQEKLFVVAQLDGAMQAARKL